MFVLYPSVYIFRSQETLGSFFGPPLEGSPDAVTNFLGYTVYMYKEYICC
jgi:hypothetical protein